MARSAITCLFMLALGTSYLTAAAQNCEVSVPATVVDAKSGTFVPSITPGMLHARVKKDFIPVTAADRIKSFRVLLLVDASGSMAFDVGGFPSYKKRTGEAIRKALDQEFPQLPAGVQVGFGVFNQRVAFGNEFTSDSARLHTLITETNARLKKLGEGRTALFDALHQSLDQFGSIQPGDTVLMLTDGGDNKSEVSDKAVEREFAQKGARIFVLLVKDTPSTPEEVAGPGIMYEVAERTGGAVYAIRAGLPLWDDKEKALPEKRDLDQFWSEQVLSAYLLRFTIPAVRKEQKWLLSIDPAANGRKKMAAGYPSRVGPCPLTAAAR